MNLNYTAFFFISFVPLLFAMLWYHPNSPTRKRWGTADLVDLTKVGFLKTLLLFALSVAFVYGYMNLTIHQLGFYELFFTDIMKGSSNAQVVVDNFLADYGEKHRHFGHGALHGALNAVLLPLPFIGFYAILTEKPMRFVWLHFGFWFLMSVLTGGLISAFI